MTDRRDYHEKRAFKEQKLSLMAEDPIASVRHAELAVLHEKAAAELASKATQLAAINAAHPSVAKDD